MTDLVERLRDRDSICMGGLFTAILLLLEAATALEAKEAEIAALQRALFFWMPGVDARLDEPTRELASEDALLLAGYDGTVDGPCWGDAVLARAETAERELDALSSSHRDLAKRLAAIGRERDEARAALKKAEGE